MGGGGGGGIWLGDRLDGIIDMRNDVRLLLTLEEFPLTCCLLLLLLLLEMNFEFSLLLLSMLLLLLLLLFNKPEWKQQMNRKINKHPYRNVLRTFEFSSEFFLNFKIFQYFFGVF